MRYYRIFLMTAVASAAVSANAFAQETAPADETQTAEAGGIADIVVTAQKRSQSLQDVAAAITVIGGEDLQTRGVTDIRAVSNLAPMIALNQEGAATQIFIRGIGQTIDAETNDPAVATNVDGIYASRFSLSGALFDVDRVEVLYGPQGTLYGRNAVGGTINVSTKLPDFNFGGEGSLRVGNYDLLHMFAAVNLPVSDTLAFRVAMDSEKRDGYMSNGGNDLDRIAGRVTMRFEPSEDFSLVARAEVSHSGGMGDTLTLRPYLDPKRPWYQPIPQGDDYYSRRNVYRFSAEAKYNLSDNVTLTYLPGFTHYNFRFNAPVGYPVRYYPNPGTGGTTLSGFSFAFLYTDRANQWTHELRLSGESDKLKWLLGGYLYDNDVPHYQASFSSNNPAVFSGGLALPYASQSGGPGTAIIVRTKSQAVFGDLTFSLSDAFRINAGGRYSHDYRVARGQFVTYGANNVANPFTPFNIKDKNGRFDWKLGFEYDVSEDAMLYGNAQSGYISSAFNPNVAGTPFEKIPPETVKAFTLGLKTMLADRRIRFNVEGFYYDYRGLQVSAFDINVGRSILKSIPKSEIYGIQVDASAQIADGLRIDANVGYLHAVIKDAMLTPPTTFTCGVGSTVPTEYCSTNVAVPIDFSGFELPKSPKWSGSVGITKDFDLANGSRVVANVSGKFQTLSWGLFSHLKGLDQPGFFKGDASLTYYAPDDKWNVGAWVTNFTNKDTFQSPATAGSYGLNTWFMDPPRMYGLRAGFKF
jgi:iron complex outermembrane receptor protein